MECVTCLFVRINPFKLLNFSFPHKFRAVGVAAHYDYTVEFTGVGEPPHGKDVGFCTQIGVFVRKKLRNVETERFEEYQRRVYKTVGRAFSSVRSDNFHLKELFWKDNILGFCLFVSNTL